jgi:hypothetical protein
MTFLQWFGWIFLASIYIVCLFTVCMLTFRKGYTLLGLIGIIFPFLWLLGAILPAKDGSRYAVSQGIRQQAYVETVTR